tara:strand:- start:196 stop:369 length:174 start_codon:yes stop_codon:yes gene_type:complete
MTTENNITITMQDVDVVRQLNPAFNDQLTIAAVSRIRAENNQRIETEAVESKTPKKS